MTRIPLPGFSRTKDAQAHPFPFQIAVQTHEFLQGSLFYASFADIAAGEFVRQPDGVSRIHEIMQAQGLDQGVADQAWEYLEKYRRLFAGVVFQSVLVGLNSHWDWYIQKLVEFIQFARDACGGPTISKQDQKRLTRVAHLRFSQQLEIVELSAGIRLSLAAAERRELVEMALVRNLGLHNRWEVDATYLKATPRPAKFCEGELRIVQPAELQEWHSLMIRLVNSSAVEVAKRFSSAPDFPI